MHAKLAKSSGKLAHDLDYCRDKRRAMRRFRFLTCATSGPIGKMRGGRTTITLSYRRREQRKPMKGGGV